MSGQHRQQRPGRTRAALRRKIEEQQAYIDLCEAVISQLSNERDDLLREKQAPGSTADTVIMPVVLEPPTHTIPIVLPDGRVLRTEPGRRPSWARDD